MRSILWLWTQSYLIVIKFSFVSRGHINLWRQLSKKCEVIWSDCNWTRTQNHLVRKWTLSYLAKLLSVHLQTKSFWVWVQLQSLNFQISRLLQTGMAGVPWHSGNYRVWIHSKMRTWHDKNMQCMICLSRPCHFKFLKGCLSQILLGPFLNTLSHLRYSCSLTHIIRFWMHLLTLSRPIVFIIWSLDISCINFRIRFSIYPLFSTIFSAKVSRKFMVQWLNRIFSCRSIPYTNEL